MVSTGFLNNIFCSRSRHKIHTESTSLTHHRTTGTSREAAYVSRPSAVLRQIGNKWLHDERSTLFPEEKVVLFDAPLQCF